MRVEKELVRYADPFVNVTIAATCSKIFRTKFMQEKYKVKLKYQKPNIGRGI